jgi:hypothetical protein
MTAQIIAFPASKIVRIVPAYQEDVRIRFAREIENRFAMIETMEGRLPARFIENCLPSDTEPRGAA